MPSELLAMLEARDVLVTLTSDDKIRVEAPTGVLDDSLRDLIRQERSGLVALLKYSRSQESGRNFASFASVASAPAHPFHGSRTMRTQRTQVRTPDLVARERKGSRLEDLAVVPAGLPQDWCEGLAALASMPPVAGFSDERWAVGVWWARQIAHEHGLVVHEAGWSALDLFGLHPTAPACRYDGMGLAFMLRPGDTLLFLDGGEVIIERLSGARHRTHRGRIGPESVLAWMHEPVD
jgi:hypothetical protein